MVEEDPQLEGMGTTLTALLWTGQRLGLVHIGDSRAYLLRDGVLTQITHDHTLVQTLIDEGRISEEEASTHPQRSVITRVLDGRPGLEPDLSVREVRAGDRYLICSDGLTGPVASRDTLRDALATPDVQAAVDRLVQLALRGGGPDNVTVIVAEVVETDHLPPLSPVVGGAAAEAPQPTPPGLHDNPAGRAHTAERREVPEPTPPSESSSADPFAGRGRSRRRLGLLAGLVAVLLLAGAGVGWAYVRSQYSVGADDNQVVVYRGVTGSVAGLDLSSVEERIDLETNQLGDLDAARVRKGIVAKNRADAMRIVERLKTMAATCAAPKPSAAASPLPSPAALPGSPAPIPSSVLPAVPVGPSDCPPS
jgi:protein phosphatase